MKKKSTGSAKVFFLGGGGGGHKIISMKKDNKYKIDKIAGLYSIKIKKGRLK